MFIMYSKGIKKGKNATLKPKILLYTQTNKCYDAPYYRKKGFILVALFFVVLLWFSILVLTLLTLHEVLKKYIIWVVEEYLAKREILAPQTKTQPKKKKK